MAPRLLSPKKAHDPLHEGPISLICHNPTSAALDSTAVVSTTNVINATTEHLVIRLIIVPHPTVGVGPFEASSDCAQSLD